MQLKEVRDTLKLFSEIVPEEITTPQQLAEVSAVLAGLSDVAAALSYQKHIASYGMRQSQPRKTSKRVTLTRKEVAP
jgi:hypothetical protein